MKLDESILEVELGEEKDKRIELIRTTTKALQRNGILIPLSGGVDSTTSLYLSIAAVGEDNVTGWFAPCEDVTDAETNSYVESIRADTGIQIIVDNSLGEVLRTAEAPEFKKREFNAVKRMYERGHRMFYQDGEKIEDAPMNVHTGVILGCGEKHIERTGRVYASVVAQHYFREAMVKVVSAHHNLTLICCANKTECLVGWYTKGGIDDTGDIKPIADLYKTQVRALANHLSIVHMIVQRDATSDMGMGTDKEMGLPDYLTMDLVLKGFLELGMTPKQISKETSIPIWDTVDVILKYRRSEHMRNGAYMSKDLELLTTKTPNYFNCVDINRNNLL